MQADGLLARPFLSFFPYKKDAVAEGKAPWRPILLLNATHEETGKRIITGHVLIERNVFIDSLDALHVLGKDVRASTAAHNSARFTYISPAGDLGDKTRFGDRRRIFRELWSALGARTRSRREVGAEKRTAGG